MEKIIYCTHAKGGAGTSLFASNLAYALSKNKRVLFLDANRFSDVDSFFGIEMKKNILNLGTFFGQEFLDDNSLQDIFSQVVYSVDKLDVLLSVSGDYDKAELKKTQKKVIEKAVRVYDFIVMDIERDDYNFLSKLKKQLKAVFLVSTVDGPSVKKTNQLWKVLDKMGLAEKTALICNQADKFSRHDLEKIFNGNIGGNLPLEVNAAWDNVVLGVPIVTNNKLSYAREIERIINFL